MTRHFGPVLATLTLVLNIEAQPAAWRVNGARDQCRHERSEDRDPDARRRYTLTANQLETSVVQLNSRDLEGSSDGAVPPFNGSPVRAGRLTLPPTTITFVAFPDAGNKVCY